MKRALTVLILGLVFLTPPVSRAAFVVPGKPTGFVNDFAGILNAEEKTALESKLSTFSFSTTMQITVATVKSLGGDTVSNAATSLFTAWGVGQAKKDNGVLILMAPNEKQVSIAVGYGLEGALTDLQSSEIIKTYMTPEFKNGRYYAGLDAGVDAVISAVKGEASTPPTGSGTSGGAVHFSFYILLAVLVFMRVLAMILGRSKSWWMGGVIGAVAGLIILFVAGITAGIIAIVILTPLGLLFDYIVSKSYDKWKSGGGKGPWFFGGGGGSSSGGGGFGGFGGFGGGRTGGGGASGGW